jgi:hypothetical protein
VTLDRARAAQAVRLWLERRREARRSVAATRGEPAGDSAPAPSAEDIELEALRALLIASRTFAGRPPVLFRLPGEAESLQQMPPIDIAWLDGPSPHHRRWLDGVLPSVAVGGLVVATGVFADRHVLDEDSEPAPGEAAAARQARAFPGYFLSHPQLASTVLPIADGVAVGVKTASLVTERGGPF